MADRDTRTEAVNAAIAVDNGEDAKTRDGELTYGFLVRRILTAADADDRENGIVRVKLDDELAEKIAQAVHRDAEHRDDDDAAECWAELAEWERDLYRLTANRIVAVLREAVQS